MNIIFNKSFLGGKEADYIREAVESCIISGDRIFTPKCHQFFEGQYGFKNAKEADLAAIESIAERDFDYEHYHIDHRLDPRLADQRYNRWVRNSLVYPRQRLLKILDGSHLIAFFIVEINDESGTLTAVTREWQGQGYGRRVWQAMLRRYLNEEVEYVSTTISARNVPVLNLYARLGFRFPAPMMTFHWVAN